VTRALVAVATVAIVSVTFGMAANVAFAQSPAPAPVQAQPTTARRIVEVQVAGGGADAASLDDTVRELLGRLTLVMESQSVGRLDPDDAAFRSTSRPSMLARVGIDLRARDVAVVIIVDGRTGDITMRRTLRRDGPPAVVREELAHVVQAAIDPMVLAERDRVSAPPPPPPPEPAPEPAQEPAPPAPVAEPAPQPADPNQRDAATSSPASHSPLALDLVTTAGAGSIAPGAGVIARAGGGATLVYRRGLRPSIGVDAHYVFPFDTGSDVALAHVEIASFRSQAGIEVFSSPLFAIDVGAGGGIDLLSVSPRSNILPSDRLGRSTTRVDPIVSAAVTGYLAIGGGTALSLVLAGDVDLASPHWVIVGAGSSQTDAFAPSRIRPLAMLGFTFTAAGEARFTPREPAR
jgi:hypothetical protein